MRAPRVAEAAAQFECRLRQTLAFGMWTLVLGEVVAFHVRADVVGEHLRVNFGRLAAVGRMAGETYCRTADCFSLEREADSPDIALRQR